MANVVVVRDVPMTDAFVSARAAMRACARRTPLGDGYFYSHVCALPGLLLKLVVVHVY